ncbi:MAG: HD domain-containing protein [Pseudomonadota bacterium]
MDEAFLPCPADLPQLPQMFRVANLSTRAHAQGCLQHTAHLFHAQASFKACWSSRQLDPRLQSGVLVSPRWSGPGRSEQGCLQIARLAVLERPAADLALFQTVLSGWQVPLDLRQRAHALWAEMPVSHRLLFNAIFWEGERFRRFCTGPSSQEGHHQEPAGNLRHTLEVAEQVRAFATDRAYVDRALAVLAALLHDAGKAEEYRLRPDGSWGLSDRGRLIGHRTTVIEWVAAAIARWGIRLPAGHEMGLLHLLAAVAHVPAWMGLRDPQTPEAELLSVADRLSGADDLMRRLLPRDAGWGTYHKHLGRRPYRVAASEPA